MLYKFLGILVWNGAKTLLRAKYGRTYMPVPVLAAAVVAAGLAVGAACWPSATPTIAPFGPAVSPARRREPALR